MSSSTLAFIQARMDYYGYIAVVIFWHICPIQLLIMATITNGSCGLFDLYGILYFSYYMIAVCIIPPTVMGVCGILVYRSMRQLHVRVRPIGISNDGDRGGNRIHSADRHLIIMVISEAAVYVVSTFIYPIVYLETGVSRLIGINKSPERLQIESFMSDVGSTHRLIEGPITNTDHRAPQVQS